MHADVVESFNAPVVIFLTVCTKDRRAVLANDYAHAQLRAAWNQADRWLTGRYVLMPDHVHLFCAPATSDSPSLETWVRYWKSLVAREWRDAAFKLWQRHFWDTQLRRSESYNAKWDYVVNNPVRAGLVGTAKEWPYQGELHRLRW